MANKLLLYEDVKKRFVLALGQSLCSMLRIANMLTTAKRESTNQAHFSSVSNEIDTDGTYQNGKQFIVI